MTSRKGSLVEKGAVSGPKCDFLMEDTLEAYLLGRLPGQLKGTEDDPEVRSVEEHLLWCEVCQATAEAEEKALAELCAALANYAPASKKPKSAKAMTMGAQITS